MCASHPQEITQTTQRGTLSGLQLCGRRGRFRESSICRDVGHLLLPHAVVQPSRTHELLMGALLLDLTVFQDDNKIYDRQSWVNCSFVHEEMARGAYQLRRQCGDGAR